MTQESDKILLVVHDAMELRRLSESLKQIGRDIIGCLEIEAAEAILPQIKAQVLITDLSFPPLFGAEGIKLIQHVKSRFPNAVAIGFLPRADETLEHLFSSVKGAKLFTKPVSVEHLVDYLKEIGSNKHLNSVGKFYPISRLEEFLKSNSIGSLLQPIVGIRKENEGQILGVESLARPQSEETLWNPEMLFDYADRMDKTFETDAICIRAALSEAQGLSSKLRLFINVRPRSIAHDEFAGHLSEVTSKFGFSPPQIVLELTEQQTIANLAEFNRSLQGLRDRGFGLALDDFGAGYANLEWLQILKPDFLKLSGVFSRGLDTDPSKQVIVRAATQMARRLAIPTILENIEKAEELEKARALGVDFGQGYFFFKPKSAKSLKEMIPGFQA